MASNDKPDTSVRHSDTGMQSISDEWVKFNTLLDRPIIIVERERKEKGQYGPYDQWLVDTGDQLVYTNPPQRVAAEYRKWSADNPNQQKMCVITMLPSDNDTGYAKYRWETWSDNDREIYLSAKESAAKVVDSDEVP